MGSLSNKWDMFINVFIDKGGYKEVLTGLANTMIIALVALVIGIILGTLIAACEVVESKHVVLRILKKICTVYVAFFRGTPVVVQLLLGYFVILPLMGINMVSLGVAILIMGLNSAAYVSEIMRSGILSVDPGQMEAGRALGLNYRVTMLSVIIPQAVKNILPTLGNELISLIKETSVVSFIGVVDLYKAFRSIGSSNYEYMIPFLIMAVIYVVVILIITGLLRIMERGLRTSDQR
ncbi:MAG: amino acid ABC transporter permease [Lachnospiraceae bacterium]|nr:amino acid ABC transporter permease [Lachnospiraceae bacterium]